MDYRRAAGDSASQWDLAEAAAAAAARRRINLDPMHHRARHTRSRRDDGEAGEVAAFGGAEGVEADDADEGDAGGDQAVFDQVGGGVAVGQAASGTQALQEREQALE